MANAVKTRAKQIMANDIYDVLEKFYLRIPFTNSFMNYERNVVIAYLSITFLSYNEEKNSQSLPLKNNNNLSAKDKIEC